MIPIFVSLLTASHMNPTVYLTSQLDKEINPEYSLKGLLLKLQYFGHLMQRADSLEKTLMLGKTEGRRRRRWQRIKDDWMASPTQWTWIWASSGRCWRTGKPGVLWPMGLQGVGHDWVTQQLDMFKINPYITRHTCPSWFPNLHPSVWSLGFALNFLLSETTPSKQVLLVPAPISLSNQLHSHPTN